MDTAGVFHGKQGTEGFEILQLGDLEMMQMLESGQTVGQLQLLGRDHAEFSECMHDLIVFLVFGFHGHGLCHQM